jgi:hypothetical protein
MRDSIDHHEGRMNRRVATTQAAKTPPKTRILEPELDELLAHLGRLIAREYVALVTQTRKNGER